MSTRQQILDGIAFALWAHALAGRIMSIRDTLGSDAYDSEHKATYDDLIYGKGTPPNEVHEPATELATLYEDANGKTIEAMYRMDPAGIEDDERHKLEPREYGAALASNALNTASPIIAVSPVTFEITLDDNNVLTWTGDVGDPHAMDPSDPDDAFMLAMTLREPLGRRKNPASMMTGPGWQTARDKLASSAAKGKQNPAGLPSWGPVAASFVPDYFTVEAIDPETGRSVDADGAVTIDEAVRDADEIALGRAAMRGGRFIALSAIVMAKIDDGGEVVYSVSPPGVRLWEVPATSNPPGGPTRHGEQSRFRKTLRGHTRTTAVIPRARFTTSETGKRQYTLAEMISANADSPAVCDRIKSMEPGATIHVDIGGGQVRVKRVA